MEWVKKIYTDSFHHKQYWHKYLQIECDLLNACVTHLTKLQKKENESHPALCIACSLRVLYNLSYIMQNKYIVDAELQTKAKNIHVETFIYLRSSEIVT